MFRFQTSLIFFSIFILLLFCLDGLTLIIFIGGTQKAKFYFLNIDCRL